MNKLLFLLYILIILSIRLVHAESYYGSGFYGDVGAGLRYDDNISRAQESTEIEHDFINTLSGRLGYQAIINRHSLLNVSAELAFERMNQFKSLNNLRLTGSLNYLYQPENGLYKPWYEFTARLSELRFNKSNIRDSQQLDIILGTGKRITNKIVAKAAYQFSQRYSEEKVFDLLNNGLDLDIEYQYSRNLIFYSQYNFTLGEVVSTAIPNTRIINAAESVAPDDVFTPGVGPGCMNRRCAYRLDAVVHKIGAGINMNVINNTEIDLAAQYHHADASGDNQYDGMIYHANIWYGF